LGEISIFAKPAKYQRTVTLPVPHLIRGSSIIRGEQMAEWLGCKLNPTEGFENDLCIYVKPSNLDNVRDGDWVDVMDGQHILGWLNDRPGVNVIAFSEYTREQYCQKIKNRMAVIPQHHCNFDRELRDLRRAIKTVGFIGGEIGFHYSEDEMKKLVEGAGFNFLFVPRYKTREDVVDFYKQIDIQLVWCSPKLQAKCPLKVVNAASFGIPTVAYPQECYQEVDGWYIKADTIDQLIVGLKLLATKPDYYKLIADRISSWAEDYHISSIAERYKELYDI